MNCMECGACAYACPARMHLTHMFKTGKQLVKDKAAADKAAAEAAYKAAIVAVDKAVNKGLLHKNNAARKKSSMTLKLNKLA